MAIKIANNGEKKQCLRGLNIFIFIRWWILFFITFWVQKIIKFITFFFYCDTLYFCCDADPFVCVEVKIKGKELCMQRL